MGIFQKLTWIYGTLQVSDTPTPARKHRLNGNVQFVLWKAGEQGHKEDFWINFDSSWWPKFIPNNKTSTQKPELTR